MARLYFSDAAPADLTAVAAARDYLRGYVELDGEETGNPSGPWVHPSRFSAAQRRALVSVAAWHPALYREQANACAGVRLELVGGATRVAVEVAPDPDTFRGDDALVEARGDGFSLDVDDCHERSLVTAEREGLVVVDLTDEPPTEEPHAVRIWMPMLSSWRVRRILSDAPMEPAPPRPVLLVLGDSISQGMDAGDPGLTWAAQVSRERGLDLLNQGLLGQVFQPSAISTLEGVVAPAELWVALGANYRHEPCYASTVRRNIRASLAIVNRLGAAGRVWVATPTCHDEALAPSAPDSCFAQVGAFIEEAVERWPSMVVVDGAELLDDDSAFRSDADHPNRRGHTQMARRIARVLAGEEPLTQDEIDSRSVPGFLRGVAEAVEPEAGLESESEPKPETPSEAKPESALETLGEEGADLPEVKAVEPDAIEVGEDSELEVDVVDVDVEVETEVETAVEGGGEPEVEVVAPEEPASAEPSPAPAAEQLVVIDDPDLASLLDLMAEGPIDSVPLEQALYRGLGRALYVSEGFCAVDLTCGYRILWGDDVVEARRAMERQRRPGLVVCLSEVLEPVVRRVWSPEAESLAYHLCVYEGTGEIDQGGELEVRALDPSYQALVTRTYSYREATTAAEVARLLAAGLILGGFDEDGELVGFVGEHPDGAIGMLEVLPRARRRGFGYALEAAKANRHLAHNWVPFCQVMADNDTSLSLQRALGFTVADHPQYFIPMGRTGVRR